MADATLLPKVADLAIFQWARPDTPNPKLAAPITSKTQTTLRFSVPPKDKTGAIIATDFIMSVTNSSNYTENILVRAANLSADGLTATNVVRGISPSGLDWETGSSDFAALHDVDSPIACSITAVGQIMLIGAVQGIIATGASQLTLGDATLADAIIGALLNDGQADFLKLNVTNNKVQYKNKGGSWINIDDVVASVLFKISANDTTASYAIDKLIAGDNVTITETNDGDNETLVIAANSQREGVTTHTTYTPAFLTGGTNAESNTAIWDSVSDGEFAITIDGVSREITSLDFTSISDMDDVAAVIQAGIRAATSSTETCVWDTDHFIITSADTTASSAMTVASTVAAPSGTDISGAGASDYMDADAGNGTVTNAVLDPTADTGKVPLLNANGNVDTDLLREVIPSGGYTAKGEFVAASAADTPVLVSGGTEGDVLMKKAAEPSGLGFETLAFSKRLGTDTTGVTLTNSTTETDLASISLPGNSLGTANGAKITMLVSDLDFNSSNSIDFRFKYGSTTFVAQAVSNGGAGTDSGFRGKIEFTVLGAGATNSQKATVDYAFAKNAPDTNDNNSRAQGWVFGTAAEDSTGDLDLKITGQWSNASVNNSITVDSVLIELIQA